MPLILTSQSSSSGGTSTLATLVGPPASPGISTGGTALTTRIDQSNAQIVSDAHGRYNEATTRGVVYGGGNQTAVTLTVGLATTYTGFVLINPIGSGVKASIISATATVSVAATVAGQIGLIVGGSTAGVTAFTAIAATLWGTMLADATAAVNNSKCAMAAAGITLVGTPRYTGIWLTSIGTGAVNLESTMPMAAFDLAGQIVVGPGGYCAFASYTAVATAVCGFVWEETPYIAALG